MYMMYLAFTVISLHLLVLPMVFGVSVSIDPDRQTGKLTARIFGIPVFSKRLSYDGLRERLLQGGGDSADDEQEPKKKGERKHGGKLKKLLIKIAFEIAKRIRVREMDLDARIGAGDAAVTAVAVGSLQIAYSQVCAFLGYRDGTIADIRPDYNSECIDLSFIGIFSLCFADIIYAVCVVVFKKLTKGNGKRSANANTVAE
ncbi:MAG: DUF2953 domain-containing protein [Roseburia sp.]|nr:DUF2953 domain-containing protein [Roseburia sp.]